MSEGSCRVWEQEQGQAKIPVSVVDSVNSEEGIQTKIFNETKTTKLACIERRTAIMTNGIIEIDVHGKNVEDAVKEVKKQLDHAKPSVYRIRIIHGFHGGTRIRNGIWDEFSYGREPKVKRITMGDNQGITELVLREF